MRILLLSFYYSPDIGPGALRAESLASALRQVVGESVEIDVFTTMPSRYGSFFERADDLEAVGSTSVVRIRLPRHRNGMFAQALIFSLYAARVIVMSRRRRWDIVVATSSRLMTAALGAFIAKKCGAKLYLDIRDLFADTMKDVMVRSPLRILSGFFGLVERWTFLSANRVNVVSAGFVPYVRALTPGRRVSVHTNGVDPQFLMDQPRVGVRGPVPVILYAGNCGDGQGLHHIVPDVAAKLGDRVQFRIIGDGGRKRELKDALVRSRVSNIEILVPIARSGLLEHYRASDILFLHLNDFSAFNKVLPSKIFEYAATGKPILAGVGGYAADFLVKEVPGVQVFAPCDAVGMINCLEALLEGPSFFDRSAFCRRFDRKKIMLDLAEDVVALRT